MSFGSLTRTRLGWTKLCHGYIILSSSLALLGLCWEVEVSAACKETSGDK